jgi:Flp pilus assembly protein CpaB
MSVEDLIGRVAIKTIPAGVPILPTMLAPRGSLPGLVVAIPDGYRAYTVKIDEASGVAYRVNPNDFVDVIVVMQVKRGRESETISKIILQNVAVGAVGQSVDQDADGKVAKSVTLLVPAEEVPKLHLAQSRGQLSLAMRGMEDKLMARSGLTNTDELIEREPVQKELAPGPVEEYEDSARRQEQNERWTVMVVNGPTDRRDLGRSSRLTTYESVNSMKVMQGAGGGGAASPDSAEALMSPRQRRAAELERQRRGYRSGPTSGNRNDQSDADMTENETEPVDDDWEDAG